MKTDGICWFIQKVLELTVEDSSCFFASCAPEQFECCNFCRQLVVSRIQQPHFRKKDVDSVEKYNNFKSS